MGNPRIPLNFSTKFHLYNYAVGNEKLFRESRNYQFFLDKAGKWIAPVANIIAYSLVPCQFDFCVQIKSRKEIASYFNYQLGRMLYTTDEVIDEDEYLKKLIIDQFAHFFSAYAQGYNKTYHRKGALFRESFYREKICSNNQLRELLIFMYTNPVKLGLAKSPELWKFSNFPDLLNDSVSKIQKQEIMSAFKTKDDIRSIYRWNPMIDGPFVKYY